MSLAPGTRLGPYEIAGPLGAGGMGEVYRAKDTRLGRDVALKIVPTHLSQKPEVRERFEREARAISSLNHPHICTLYDVGREGEADYFVMELLDGESLGARLERGPLKLDEALRIAAQIADGLAAAHKQGIVHRDLKPGNVVLTKSGAKILDFGVAKLRDGPIAETVTRTTPLTSAGSMVGTVQYMAPEQLEGKPVDERADIFAFGALLYEMVTGKRAFDGASSASVIAAILKDEPRPVSELLPTSPAALDRVVTSCLAKDPDERWQSAGDLARELRWILEGKSAGAALPRTGPRSPIPWIVAAAAVLLAGFLALRLGRAPSIAPRALTLDVVPPAGSGISTDSYGENPIALSPDGTNLALCLHEGNGPNALWIRTLSTGEIRRLPGTEGASQPFWSPDGRSLGFFARRKLKRADVAGGAVLTLADVRDPRGGSWGAGGTIVFTPEAVSGVMKVSAEGGPATRATKLNASEATHRFPVLLPDGDHVLYLARDAGAGAGESAAIWVESLGSHERKKLLSVGSNAIYASDHLLYVKQGVLVAQRFDRARLTLDGEAAPLATGVRMDERFSRGQFTASAEGMLAYTTGKVTREGVLRWIGRDGAVQATLGEPAVLFAAGTPTISPDPRFAAMTILGDSGKADIWRVNLQTGARSRVTIDETQDHFGFAWSPDGSRLAINGGDRAGHEWIGLISADGSGEAAIVYSSVNQLPYPLAFSHDGHHLLIGFNAGDKQLNRILDLELGAGTAPKDFSSRPGFEISPQFAPNGRFVAYSSDSSGRDEVYVAPYPRTDRLWQVSQGGGGEPRWSRDGKELFFVDPDNRLQSAVVDTNGAGFEIGTIRPLFQVAGEGNLWRYDVGPDASRFLVCARLDDGSRAAVTLVTDWTRKLAVTP
jgi:serine/threonine protein kinase/Tol biopolymer transport system component